jgi:putative tryptophan/tyrosine transport system substrate-binding protein
MKKLFWSLVIGVVVLISTVGIIGTATAAQKEIAVIWAGKSRMTTNVQMGLLPALRQLAPDLKVDLYRELKNIQAAGKIFQEVEPKVDGIVFLRSSGAKYLATADPKVPCFVGGCNNPAELGAIKNLNAPEGKITGVTYFIPYDKRFQIIKTLFPNTKSIGLLLEKGHPSTPIEQHGVREQCEKLGIAYHDVVASNLQELLDGTKALLGSVNLIIISNSRLPMDNVVNLLPILNRVKMPTFSFAMEPVKSGAVAGMAADDAKLGRLLAASVVDVVVNGKPISQVPVKTDPDPRISINESMMHSLGLKFPDTLMKKAELVQ